MQRGAQIYRNKVKKRNELTLPLIWLHCLHLRLDGIELFLKVVFDADHDHWYAQLFIRIAALLPPGRWLAVWRV